MQLGTYLEDYKRKGTHAQPYFVITFFTELLFAKGLVLLRGDIINNSMTKGEGMRVWELLQQSYFEEEKHGLVE
jgi:ATP synthase F1 complex assembly factor 1